MKNATAEPQTFEEQWKLITQDGRLLSKILLRVIWIATIATIIAFIFGYSFVLIIQAIFLLGISLYRYWQPAYSFGNKIANLQHAPQHLIKSNIRWYSVPFFAIRILMLLFLFFFGFYTLISNGFCSQNFILLILYGCS
jgi:hypothetical protein